MVLRDYGDGVFPPRYDDEEATFEAERAYRETLQSLGKTKDQLDQAHASKPFWHGTQCRKYLRDFARFQSALFDAGVKPPSTLLEVGCGSGWFAEFLCLTGFKVVATTIDPAAADVVAKRVRSLDAKGIPHELTFRACAMENVDEVVADLAPFDVAFVYEALHHAHDWRKAIEALHRCLRPGGRVFLLDEPNLSHTFVSYRVGRLSNTHEIGFNPWALRKHIHLVGFREVKVLKNRVHGCVRPIWITARKPSE